MRKFMMLWSDGKKQKMFQIALAPLIIFFAVILVSIRMSASYAFAGDGEYIKYLPKDTAIDWSTNACEKRAITDPLTNKTVAFRCKQEGFTKAHPASSTYLMDTKNTLIHIPDFFPTLVYNLGNGSALVLISDDNTLFMLLEFDKKGVLVGQHVIDGEPLPNKERTSLAYSGLLVWYSNFPSRLDTCAQELLKSLGKIRMEFSALYKGFPIEINVIVLPQNVTGLTCNPNKDEAIAKEMDKTISDVLTLIKNKDEDIFGPDTFGERLFFFLAANSSNNKMLSSLVHKYRKYLGKKILARYASTQSCKPIQ